MKKLAFVVAVPILVGTLGLSGQDVIIVPVWGYIIQATAGVGGSIDPAGDVVVAHGDDRTFTITPEEGYEIADVLVDDVSVGVVEEYTFTDVTQDHTIHTAFESPAVQFHDSNLEAAVRDALGRPTGEITVEDMKSLAELHAGNRGIVLLEGLEHATNLTQLRLHANYISDLLPLAGLLNLEELGLGRNKISDLSPLAGLASLTRLDLENNQLRDLSPLASLVELRGLILDRNEISDLTPLSSLVRLEDFLVLEQNQISDLSPLSALVNLKWLILADNQISDLSPLSELVNLKWLDLWNNQISDLSPLSKLVDLTSLELAMNAIVDLKPLEELRNLDRLKLGYNQISDLSPLSGLSELTELNLRKNQISDLGPLSGLDNLMWLLLYGNQISNLAPLSSLANLRGLHLGENSISDISPLANLAELEWLALWLNQISDLSPLAGLDKLTELALVHNDVNDISPLAELGNLKELHLGGNEICDLAPLEGLVNLTLLRLESNRIVDISALAGLINLGLLNLEFNQITDLSALVDNSDAGGLGAGDEVDLRHNLLDTRPGSQVMDDIQTLINSGVNVEYEPQDEHFVLDVDKVGEGIVHLNAGEIPLPHSAGYAPFTEVQLQAFPADGWEWTRWEVNEEGIEDTEGLITVEMDEHREAIAHFIQLRYTIMASAGEGGSIDPEGDVLVDHGEAQTFAMTPDEGYAIVDVLVNGASIGAEGSYTFESVMEDHAITVLFLDYALDPIQVKRASVEGDATVAEDDTVDGVGRIDYRGDAIAITTASFDDNPASTGLFQSQDVFFDVHLSDSDAATKLLLRFGPTDPDTVVWYWQKPDGPWRQCSDQEYVDPYVEVTIRRTGTLPNLEDDFSGVHFGLGKRIDEPEAYYPWDVSFYEVKVFDYQVFDPAREGGETPPVSMRLLDGRFQPVTTYRPGDQIYLEVTDYDQNEDSRIAERISARWDRGVMRASEDPMAELFDGLKVFLHNPVTGVTRGIDLQETGPNTGVFRSTTGVTVRDLGGRENHPIVAFYQDPSNHSDIATKTVRVQAGDPAVPDPVAVAFDRRQYSRGDTGTITVTEPQFAGQNALTGEDVLVLKDRDDVVVAAWDELSAVTTDRFAVTFTVPEDVPTGTIRAVYTHPTDPGRTLQATAQVVVAELEDVTGVSVEPAVLVDEVRFGIVAEPVGAVADRLTVRVYDLTGRKVDEISGTNTDSLSWMGGNLRNSAYVYVAVAEGPDGGMWAFRGFVYIKR